MAIRFSGRCLYIDLDITSAILNHCGTKGFLVYVSFLTYKKYFRKGNKNDFYARVSDLKEFSLLKNEKDFTSALNKLMEMGLIVKKGDYYTACTKTKRWLGYTEENYPTSLTLGGTLVLSMDEFYNLKNCPLKNVEERLYLTINNAVRRGKSLSRGFIQKATGVHPKKQALIEEKYDDVLQQEMIFPVDALEQENIEHIPLVKASVDFASSKLIKKSKDEKTHCVGVQLGNAMAIHPSLCHGFLLWKKARKKRESLPLNEPVQQEEVCGWDSIHALVDLSTEEEDRSKRNHDLMNIKDKRWKTWKWFKRMPYQNIRIFNTKGYMVPLRDHLRRYSF
jgi:hypothetical protein